MDASKTIIQPIIEGTKQYIVPLYQRKYSWQKEEWKVLLDDLIWLYENENIPTHFIGSLVTIQKNKPEGIAKYFLIDGQQRITTKYLSKSFLKIIG